MVAFHYPPIGESSGLQRTLKFSHYLVARGWHPIILTASPRAYGITRDDQMAEIPEEATVVRAFALDTAVHLAVANKYPSILASPDRWTTWWLPAVVAGLGLVRRYRPAALWSTYPIATAHRIGHSLQRLTGLPWIADFRDSMTDDIYPTEPRKFKAFRRIERSTLLRCSRAVFTTPGAREMYAQRYPGIPNDRLAVIANGYDEQNFLRAEDHARMRVPAGRPSILVHSGLLYRRERDPTAFFDAITALKQHKSITADRLRVVLRAPGFETHYQEELAARGIDDIIRIEPSIAYEEALSEMLAADGLLLFQAANCNHQIPAKVYEYLRARRPLLALTDTAGDTANLLRQSGIDSIVALDDANAIAAALVRFLDQIAGGTAPIASDSIITSHSREARTDELLSVLDGVTTEHRVRSAAQRSGTRS